MSVTVQITANSSIEQKAKYNPNQKLLSVSSGNVPGLQSDLTLFPESVLQLLRAAFNKSGSTILNTGNDVTSFGTSQIITTDGFLSNSTDIFYKEALTLVPTSESYWGIYEIELVTEEANPQSLEFYNSNTKSVFSSVVNTRYKYTVKIYEKYETTASYPTVTAGRIEWLRYKKNAAFGDLSEVINLFDSNRAVTNIAQISSGIINLIKTKSANYGYSNINLAQSSASKIALYRNSFVDVDGSQISVTSSLEIDFNSTTNIYRVDASNQITAISETQNKHMYILLTSLGSLQASIIPDAEMEGSSHVYANNPNLLKDYYAVTPTIFDVSKNGYYKNGKRIIAVCRISATNTIDFFYTLGNGHRFRDTQHLSIGQTFTEVRWLREHPSCYIPDGATIASMSTEAPELLQVYGTNVLPNWADRFPRNIALAGGRAVRDVQEDAFQGHWFKTPANLEDGVITIPSSVFTYNNRGVAAELEIQTIATDGVNGTPRIANETRGKNFAQLIQIVRG